MDDNTKHDNSPPQEPQASAAEFEALRTRRDMGRLALFIAILSVLLLAVFFYALNRNMTGLAEQVHGLARMQPSVTEIQERTDRMQERMADMEESIAAAESLPARVRRQVQAAMLADTVERLEAIAQDAETEEHSAKLHQAMSLLDEVRGDLIP
jgi:septal ring factor EnvC (AmiA/AmiB activator)